MLLVKEVTPEQLSQQPGGVVHHPAWSLGRGAHTRVVEAGRDAERVADSRPAHGMRPTGGEACSPVQERLRRVQEPALRTYAAPMNVWVEQCKEQGINAEFPALIDSWLQRAMDAGYGDEEISAIIKVLR